MRGAPERPAGAVTGMTSRPGRSGKGTGGQTPGRSSEGKTGQSGRRRRENKDGRPSKSKGRPDDDEPYFMRKWNACMKDPECRARLFQAAVYASIAYTFMGFVIILLVLAGFVTL